MICEFTLLFVELFNTSSNFEMHLLVATVVMIYIIELIIKLLFSKLLNFPTNWSEWIEFLFGELGMESVISVPWSIESDVEGLGLVLQKILVDILVGNEAAVVALSAEMQIKPTLLCSPSLSSPNQNYFSGDFLVLASKFRCCPEKWYWLSSVDICFWLSTRKMRSKQLNDYKENEPNETHTAILTNTQCTCVVCSMLIL